MGAPKQKWTSEEETAIKAGVAKYEEGKWSTILKDPVFGPILHSRSNVDLKDKWRNVKAAASGLGSRHKARLALKNSPKATKHDDKSITTTGESDINVVNAEPLMVISGSSEDYEPDFTKKPVPRLDNLVLDAIAKLKEPCGSSRAEIATYIKGNNIAPPNLERLVADSLKLLTGKGNLIKVKHQYRITPPTGTLVLEPDASNPALDESQKKAPNGDSINNIVLIRSQIDAELQKMKSMSPREAAVAAAQAVAEAEALIAEAEQAEREAEEAEANAEAAQCFAEAAMSAYRSLKCKTVCA